MASALEMLDGIDVHQISSTLDDSGNNGTNSFASNPNGSIGPSPSTGGSRSQSQSHSTSRSHSKREKKEPVADGPAAMRAARFLQASPENAAEPSTSAANVTTTSASTTATTTATATATATATTSSLTESDRKMMKSRDIVKARRKLYAEQEAAAASTANPYVGTGKIQLRGL
jgi:hypothetical protein